MFFNCIFLALSVSIDSLGIGITYGIKNTKISKSSNIILFLIAFFTTLGSIGIGMAISLFFSSNFSALLGSAFLIFLGLYNIYKTLFKSSVNFDFDNSSIIDKKEAFFLGVALSIDSMCVGIGSGAIGLNYIILPTLVATFQLIFLNVGNYITKSVIKNINLSEKTLSIFSAFILIFVGFFRILL